MNNKLTRIVATFLLANLLAGAAIANDGKRDVKEQAATTAPATASVEIANAQAIKDAIEAVLVDNRLDLDIRFNAHKSLASAD
jgi:hypothetical protein